jgi:hypothetical protein
LIKVQILVGVARPQDVKRNPGGLEDIDEAVDSGTTAGYEVEFRPVPWPIE